MKHGRIDTNQLFRIKKAFRLQVGERGELLEDEDWDLMFAGFKKGWLAGREYQKGIPYSVAPPGEAGHIFGGK